MIRRGFAVFNDVASVLPAVVLFAVIVATHHSDYVILAAR